MERKTRLLNLLEQAHEMEIDFVGALSGQERARIGTLEDWSAKDIISHTTARKALMADNLLAVFEGRCTTGSEDLDHENAVLFQEHRDKTWDEVLRLAADTFQRVVAQVESLGEHDLARSEKLFPWQGEQPVWRHIVGSGCIHPIGHMAEFHRNLGNPELAGEMIGRIARSMAGLDDSPLWRGAARYQLACHYSLVGAREEAIRELRESLVLNPGLIDWSKEDPDLAAIRGEPEVQAIYED